MIISEVELRHAIVLLDPGNYLPVPLTKTLPRYNLRSRKIHAPVVKSISQECVPSRRMAIVIGTLGG